MKSRIAFLFVLAAFFNPVNVFAVDYSGGKTACETAVKKLVEDHKQDVVSGKKQIKNGIIQKADQAT